MLLMLVGLALAQEPVEPPLAPDPAELVHQAEVRLRHGDYEGVRILCEQALAIDGDHQRSAQYLTAQSWEWGGDPQQALGLYDALESAYPAGQIPDDLRFRRAECLGRLQRYDEAQDELDRLPNVDRPPLDRLKIDVLHARWDLELGRTRRGYKGLVAALDAAPAGIGTWYQADAHHTLLVRALDSAAALRFEGSDHAKEKALQERVGLIKAAQDQLAAIITLEEPKFALEGFLALARAYHAFGRDLLAESPPKGLTPEQLALNRQLLREKVDQHFWTKSALAYDQSLQYAARMDWVAEPVPTLRTEYDALVAEVDALATGP